MLVAHSNSHIYFFAFAPSCLCVHACYLFKFFFIVIGVFWLVIHSIFSFIVISHICHDCNIFFLCFDKFSLNSLFILKSWYTYFSFFCFFFTYLIIFRPSCFIILFSFVLLLTFVVSFFCKCHFVILFPSWVFFFSMKFF